MIEPINFSETCKDQSIGNLIEKGIENHNWIISSEKEVRLNGNLGINIGPKISVIFIKNDEKWKFYKFIQENSNNFELYTKTMEVAKLTDEKRSLKIEKINAKLLKQGRIVEQYTTNSSNHTRIRCFLQNICNIQR